MDERDFYDERTELKTHTLTCPNCSQANEYQVNWLVRIKRRQPPRGADDHTLARFAKAKSYMLRRDDILGCKNIRCRKRFEIAGLQSVANLEDAPTGSATDRAARIRAAFGKSRVH
jgi:hypothetical protein